MLGFSMNAIKQYFHYGESDFGDHIPIFRALLRCSDLTIGFAKQNHDAYMEILGAQLQDNDMRNKTGV